MREGDREGEREGGREGGREGRKERNRQRGREIDKKRERAIISTYRDGICAYGVYLRSVDQTIYHSPVTM